MKPIHISDLPCKEVVRRSTGEPLSSAASVSDAFGLKKLLVHRETIEPGRRTAPIHKHSTKEEVFYVEHGSPSVWIDGTVHQLSAGDVVGFQATDGMRMVFNDSESVAVIWTLGTTNDDDQVEFLDVE